ncbi:MAG: hypothetical protein E7439_03370 [Ruminococcaceae bacterium]|nr:hypothetical protein [Oscillospiraceae bacterium]
MINKLLNAAAIPAREARFPDPPAQTFAVYFDSVDADGPDVGPCRIFTHGGIVELYAPSIEDGNEAKQRLAAEFHAMNIPYSTQGWYWLNDIRRYQEIYEFTYIEKI